MLHKNKITRSLCAVMLSLSFLVPGVMSVPAEASPTDPNDVYSMDVEFGNLSFYYDYGTWDVNDMRYEASATSSDPANGTVNGYPGWYGFDGIANKISIKNGSETGEEITVSLSYRDLSGAEIAEAGADGAITGVTFAVEGWTSRAADYIAPVPAQNVVDAYIHLSGEPQLNGASYDTATMKPIGMLILKIEAPM